MDNEHAYTNPLVSEWGRQRLWTFTHYAPASYVTSTRNRLFIHVCLFVVTFDLTLFREVLNLAEIFTPKSTFSLLWRNLVTKTHCTTEVR